MNLQYCSVMSLQNASKEAITEWMKFHRASDSLTTTDLGKFYIKNGTLKFANNELLVGLDAITEFFDTTFPLLARMKHEIVNLDTIGNKIYQTCTISYGVKDDPYRRTIKIKAMGVVHLVSGADFKSGEALIEHFDVFLDASEVFGIVGEVQELRAEGKL
ncbi:hypothetical protein ONS95_012977 [Cadophora gregata]|uniref:uncharacterized protein n=1 Tax=Cadophora gregata TaxID=51156 RepID=UPI0026DAC457|nr:uncharacterized protein ONS95_012977 [Cadophora gregata]KAK0101035.1 hypothetical protein ONS96_006265 [Cadophora gregata f. sp. sojae]KAK0115935.1 hypothetical protein ONS95_012977 [Cadophora gregata]